MSAAGGAKLRVLVVDDDEVDREAILRALAATDIKAEVVEASDVLSARKLLRESEFDCLLVDYYLPGGNGVDVIRAVAGARVAVPAIVLTGRGDEDLAVDLMKSGASDYLVKGGLTPSALAQSIRRALRVSRAERAAERVAAASLRIHAAISVAETLDITATEARAILGAHAATTRLDAPGAAQLTSVSLSPKLASIDAARAAGVAWLEAPLLGHDGALLGAVCVADPADGTFRRSDEVVLRQLAQSAAIALEKARLVKAAQDAARMRDDVLAIVSHDLRSPLNTISMSADLLRQSVDGRERTLVERIARGVTRMNRLIADLLDASCIDVGKLAVVPRPERAAAIVREAADSAEPIASSRGCRVACGAVDEAALVVADRQRILQVLSNLVGNAIKFSPAAGAVTLEVVRDGATARFSVLDEGPGIAPEHMDRLFDRYYKANRESRDGAGLGLFIARGIVEAHGGRIRVESRRGGGTTVTFSLPLEAGAGEQTPSPAACGGALT